MTTIPSESNLVQGKEVSPQETLSPEVLKQTWIWNKIRKKMCLFKDTRNYVYSFDNVEELFNYLKQKRINT